MSRNGLPASFGYQKASRGGRLTAEQRNDLPKSDFALPGGRYPVPDKSHARVALSRVSQFGTPSEKAAVRQKVHSKYPDIDVKRR